jgi:hypothetical protein
MTTPTCTEDRRPLEATAHDPVVDDVAPHRELAVRTADRITVTLLWRPGDPGVLLRVDDARTGVRFELDVPGRDALQAFNHPFAYAG